MKNSEEKKSPEYYCEECWIIYPMLRAMEHHERTGHKIKRVKDRLPVVERTGNLGYNEKEAR